MLFPALALSPTLALSLPRVVPYPGFNLPSRCPLPWLCPALALSPTLALSLPSRESH